LTVSKDTRALWPGPCPSTGLRTKQKRPSRGPP